MSMKKRNAIVLICLMLILAMTLTLVACDKTEKFKVTFSGEGIETFTQQVEAGKTVQKPVDPTWTGHRFEYWALNGEEYDFSTPVEKNIELVAVWEVVGTEDSGFNFELAEDETYIISSKQGFDYDEKYGDSVTLPSSYNNVEVTAVGSMTYLTNYEVIIPSTIKEIKDSAFEGNLYIGVVDMSAFGGVIGDKAFADSEVKIVQLGKATSIGKNAFKNAPISAITIPETVTAIGDEALLSVEIMEIGFAGAIPQLGQNVFGDGRRSDDKISVIATQTAWETLIGEDDNTNNAAIAKKTGLAEANIVYYTDEEMNDGMAMEGIYRNKAEAKIVYHSVSLTAVIYDYLKNSDMTTIADLYDESHFYVNLENLATRETYFFDNTNHTIVKLQKNANGEVIHDGVLYDYVGNEIIYAVPAGITKIAGGAGFANTNVRFLDMGSDVTEIGSYAFSSGQLFGITIGENVSDIAPYAFFGHNYLQQIIFKGTTVPTIGSAAFCTQLETQGIGPSILCTTTALSTDLYVYTVLSTWGWPTAPADALVEALNASLEELKEDGLLPIFKESEDDEGEYVSYSTSNLKQLSTYSTDFFSVGKQYETPYGTITMSGTSKTGYATIEFAEESDYNGISYVYYKSMDLPGYSSSDANDPKEIEIFTRRSAAFYSFKIYGRLVDGQFVARGTEAGTFGEIGKDTLDLDGFGKFVFYDKEGNTVEGSYTVSGSTISFDGLSGAATIIERNDKVIINYNNKDMLPLDAAAGVYYDTLNGAKLTMDGRGHATIEFEGETTTVNYTFKNSSALTVDNFKGKEREWSFSKTSKDYVIKFYYDPDNYNKQLSFKTVETGLKGTFTNGSSSVTLDGYYAITINDGTAEKVGTYLNFQNADTYLVTVDGEKLIMKLNKVNNTFEFVSGNEAGVWYTASSANYRWYFDGEGNFIYYNGDYNFGTYEFDTATGELNLVYAGNAVSGGEKSKLDLNKGIGTLIYNYSGNTYSAVSRIPFDSYKTTWGSDTLTFSSNSMSIEFTSGDKQISTSQSFNFCKTGNTLFIYPYGKPMVIVTMDGELNGNSCEFSYVLTSSDVTFTVNVRATFEVTDGVAKVTVELIGQPQVVTK